MCKVSPGQIIRQITNMTYSQDSNSTLAEHPPTNDLCDVAQADGTRGSFGHQSISASFSTMHQTMPMSVNLSELKSERVYEFICANLSGSVPDVPDEMMTFFFDGDRASAAHVLSRQSMQGYIETYWSEIDPKLPLRKRPSVPPVLGG